MPNTKNNLSKSLYSSVTANYAEKLPSKVNKPTGKKHFDLSEEDRIAEILEHPLPPTYTTNTEEEGDTYVADGVRASSVI